MAIWFSIMSFLMGGCISFCLTYTLMKKEKNEKMEELLDSELKLNKEWLNFMNYNGTSGGQVDIES